MSALLRYLVPLSLFVCALAAHGAELPALVAHAGGAHEGREYRNSIEALDASYRRGLRWFELDFSWTTDEQLVGLHDWDRSFPHIFGAEVGDQAVSLAAFAALATSEGDTPVTPLRLAEWLARHPESVVVTDIKSANLKGLRQLADALWTQRGQLAAQIFATAECQPVRAMGYGYIVLGLYRMGSPDPDALIAAHEQCAFDAFSMPLKLVFRPDFLEALLPLGVPIYVHTINDPTLAEGLRSLGIHGVYTDVLTP